MRRIVLLILAALLVLSACGGDKAKMKSTPINFDRLQERDVEIVGTVKHEGFVIGADFERAEIYIKALSPLKKKFALVIVDIPTGNVKKEIDLAQGDFQSPKEFYNPAYMQFVKDRYIIVDQFHKIMVYDEQLNYLYTNMFNRLRYSLIFSNGTIKPVS